MSVRSKESSSKCKNSKLLGRNETEANKKVCSRVEGQELPNYANWIYIIEAEKYQSKNYDKQEGWGRLPTSSDKWVALVDAQSAIFFSLGSLILGVPSFVISGSDWHYKELVTLSLLQGAKYLEALFSGFLQELLCVLVFSE